MLKATPVIYLFAAIIFSCNSADKTNSETSGTDSATTTMNTTTDSSSGKDGWVTLFDGEKIEGWHTYGKTGTGSWKVSDGVLFLDSTKTGGKRDEGDLVTDKEYENFHLSLDWKIGNGGNS